MFLNLMLAFDRDLYFYSLHASLSFPANRCLNSRSHPSRLRTCGAWLMQLSRQQGRSLRKGGWTISSFLVPTWHSKLINLLFGTAVEPVPVVTSSQSSASSQPSVAFEIPLPLNFRAVSSDSFPVTFVIVPPALAFSTSFFCLYSRHPPRFICGLLLSDLFLSPFSYAFTFSLLLLSLFFLMHSCVHLLKVHILSTYCVL